MVNKWKSETNLPMNIWIDENQTYLKRGVSKRILLQLNDFYDMSIDESGEMDLDGNICSNTVDDIMNLDQNQLMQLRNFIHNNRYALQNIADIHIPLFKIWKYMIMGGEIASNDEIKNLNKKVDELIVKKV